MTSGNRQTPAYRNCAMMNLALWTMLLALVGCRSSVEESLWQQIRFLEEEKTTLKLDNEKLLRENQEHSRQIAALQGLDANERLSAIDTLYKIEIASRSGLFDKDKDGVKETLVVYVLPIDRTQDSIKASGEMAVELWNLDSDHPQGGLVKQWQIAPDQLQQLWASILTTHCYRLSFPVDDILRQEFKNLTVKVRFTDYGTGKVLTAQHIIE